MVEMKYDSKITKKYNEFLRGLRKSDREQFQEFLHDIESHYYMLSSSETTLTEDLLLGFLLNQKKINNLKNELRKLQNRVS